MQTGNKVIKSKKPALQKHDMMKKKHSAGIAGLTEKSLAAKAGHLEMLRGGKKDSNGQTPSVKQTAQAKKGKGK